MEAGAATSSPDFKERISSLISELPIPFLRFPPFLRSLSLPAIIVWQTYRSCGRIAEHEGIPHPVGSLFRLNRDYEIHSYAGVGGGIMLENATDDARHTVSVTYGGQSIEEKLSLSASHMLGESNHLKLQYASDLCKGSFHPVVVITHESRKPSLCLLLFTFDKDAYCSLCVCHKFDDESLLHARYWEGLANDPVVEVEVQHQQKRLQAIGKLQKCLGSDYQEFSLQSKNILPADVILRNIVHTDFRNDMFIGAELVSTSSIHTASSRVLFGRVRRELSVKGSRSFRNNVFAESSIFTDFDMQQNISIEAKCKVLGENEVSAKFSWGSNCIQEVNVKGSLFFETNSWKWNYRKQTVDGYSLGLEWEKKGFLDNLLSLNVELNGEGVTWNGQINHYFVR